MYEIVMSGGRWTDTPYRRIISIRIGPGHNLVIGFIIPSALLIWALATIL
jgi:hypothetical protein